MSAAPRASGGLALVVTLAVALAATPETAGAHSGPPYPIVTDQLAGPYRVSVWTDPDSTDDGSAGGQFWVTVELAGGGALPADTAVRVTIAPLDRPGLEHVAEAAPVNGDRSRQFALLPLDHEGRFGVRAEIAGDRGTGAVRAEVEATYDLRPPPAMLALYLMPFLLVGFLWLKLLLKRRRAAGETPVDLPRHRSAGRRTRRGCASAALPPASRGS